MSWPVLPLIGPPDFPLGVQTASQKAGCAYERKVGRWVRPLAAELGFTLLDHPWLEGPCQPDFLLVAPSGAVIIVEAKLTWVDCSAQRAKYQRVLAGRPTTFVQVCRRLTPQSPAPVDFLSIEDNSVVLLWI